MTLRELLEIVQGCTLDTEVRVTADGWDVPCSVDVVTDEDAEPYIRIYEE